jgi:hypothetical protein
MSKPAIKEAKHRNPPPIPLAELHRIKARELMNIAAEVRRVNRVEVELKAGEIWRCDNGSLVLIGQRTPDQDGDWMRCGTVLRTAEMTDDEDDEGDPITRTAAYEIRWYHENGCCSSHGQAWNALTRVAANFQEFFGGAHL